MGTAAIFLSRCLSIGTWRRTVWQESEARAHVCVRHTGRAMPILCGESPGIAFLSRSVVSHSTSALALIDALVCLSSRREWNAGQMVSPCPLLWITLTDRQGVNSHAEGDAQTHTHTAYVHMNTISDTHTHTAAETAYTVIIIKHPRGFFFKLFRGQSF